MMIISRVAVVASSSLQYPPSPPNASMTTTNDNESPHSTISQSAASTQLQRKRLLDVASRSLAQLATASRHSSTKCCSSRGDGSGDRTSPSNGKSSNDDGISPDFDPPSTRSLLA